MEKKETLEIWLGRGDKIISCALNDDEGWVGICISTPGDKQPIGTTPDHFGATTDDLELDMIIRTKDPQSLRVLIQTCEYAIAHLEKEERVMTAVEFDGVTYNDDRMFILYICKCTIKENADSIRTIIHYQEIPLNCIWSVATFRNNPRYTLRKIDHFNNKEEAEAFVAHVEPQTPLVSLGGLSPTSPLSFSEYSDWKSEMNLKEYDCKSMFLEDSVNPTDTLTRIKH